MKLIKIAQISILVFPKDPIKFIYPLHFFNPMLDTSKQLYFPFLFPKKIGPSFIQNSKRNIYQ